MTWITGGSSVDDWLFSPSGLAGGGCRSGGAANRGRRNRRCSPIARRSSVVQPSAGLRQNISVALQYLESWLRGTGAVALVLFGHAESVRSKIISETDLLVLHSASVVERMTGQTRPPSDALVVIVSRWPEFLRSARTMLLAAGLDADALSFRDARERGWEKGIRAATFVITDSLMAAQIPEGCETKVFRVISAASLLEISDYAERYF